MSTISASQGAPPDGNPSAKHTEPKQYLIKFTNLDQEETICSRQLYRHTTWFHSLIESFKRDKSPVVTIPIDFEPEHFGHILRYIRTGLYPVFYDEALGGHNVPKYLIVKKCADMYGVEKLAQWLANKRYEEVVVKEYTIRWEQRKQDQPNPYSHAYMPSDKTLTFIPTGHTEKVYTCPRDIAVHRGDKSRCGQACFKAEHRDYEDRFEEEPAGLVLVVGCKTVWRTELMEEDRIGTK